MRAGFGEPVAANPLTPVSERALPLPVASPGWLLRPARRHRIPGPRAARPLIRQRCRPQRASEPIIHNPFAVATPVLAAVPDLVSDAEPVTRQTAELPADELAAVDLLAAVGLPSTDAPVPDPPASAGSAEAMPASPGSGRRTWQLAIGAAVAAAVAVAAVIAVTGALGTSRPAPQPAASVDQASIAAAAWMVTALPTDSHLTADGPMRNALVAQGFSPELLTDLTSPGSPGYLVSTASARASAQAGDAPLARLLATSVPIASFGAGSGRVEVRQLLPAGQALADRAVRVTAGQSLLKNSAVTVDPELAGELTAGQLDLRAATLIAVLAARGPVRLDSLPQDPAEHAAGAPARVIWLSLGSTNPHLAQLIDTMPAAYQPARSTRLPDGRYALEWPPDLDISAPVS